MYIGGGVILLIIIIVVIVLPVAAIDTHDRRFWQAPGGAVTDHHRRSGLRAIALDAKRRPAQPTMKTLSTRKPESATL